MPVSYRIALIDSAVCTCTLSSASCSATGSCIRYTQLAVKAPCKSRASALSHITDRLAWLRVWPAGLHEAASRNSLPPASLHDTIWGSFFSPSSLFHHHSITHLSRRQARLTAPLSMSPALRSPPTPIFRSSIRGVAKCQPAWRRIQVRRMEGVEGTDTKNQGTPACVASGWQKKGI
ncbi:hypothetical protein CI102_582 [Trichoderma harzianum]|uniref:Uncharacterized protein n=1 Tax=Trichoderma harzianum CBS 226.95 TaxID=983964 RepID=A0A2T4A282_TRIHA|nr:hypothetical protein M431DRAFT_235899 [Trichoderma harzianum CBS 226.95]PKK54242.1 hypothetical protein CI102_582 [Trichoderma harzianum]PTB51159.1 hypothetical protein M431DRAFT_235899 [Trichoderma harzianum CBS 226.95]